MIRSAEEVEAADDRPLIAHVVLRLSVGGLENGLVNLVNGSGSSFRHVIICLEDYSDFRARLSSADVRVHSLNKRRGKDLRVYFKLWRLLRNLSPSVVHTRNLPTVLCQIVAFFAGVRYRIHGEHGWDTTDSYGTSKKYLLVRRVVSLFVTRYVALSAEIETWLRTSVRVESERITRICNGVDTARFRPAEKSPRDGDVAGRVIVGTVGRMRTVKNQLDLVRAYLFVLDTVPDATNRLGLVLVGDGPLREQARAMLADADALAHARLPGDRDDVAELMRSMDIFVLPSLREGISNTILEAMACGVPVIATDVGGNAELVVDGHTGFIVTAQSPAEIAARVIAYLDDPGLRKAHGENGRARVVSEFGLLGMVDSYCRLYSSLLGS